MNPLFRAVFAREQTGIPRALVYAVLTLFQIIQKTNQPLYKPFCDPVKTSVLSETNP
jgi:hypothetical protein